MPFVDHGRAVGFGQPVDMRDVEPGIGHAGEHRLRRRRGGGDELDALGSGRFSSAVALSSVDITIGAPHRWVTPCSAMASYIAFGRTQRRHTCVPATTASVQGKHQPLQWNIGSVHR